jgi:hypothetical protein
MGRAPDRVEGGGTQAGPQGRELTRQAPDPRAGNQHRLQVSLMAGLHLARRGCVLLSFPFTVEEMGVGD